MRIVHRILLALVMAVGVLGGTLSPASAACPIDDPTCGGPTTYTYRSTLTVTAPSPGSVASDAPSGRSISCPSACGVTDTQVMDEPGRPTTGWPTYTLTASGGPVGYLPTWNGCDSVNGSRQCVVDNNAPTRNVSLSWYDAEAPHLSLVLPSKVGPTTPILAGATDNSWGPISYTWRVDGAPFATGAPSISLGSFDAGQHTVLVQARDSSGNIAQLSRATTLDKTASMTLSATPSFTNGPVTLTFTPDADVPSGSVRCRIDSAPFGACTSATTFTLPVDDNTTDGPKSLQVMVTDDVGNTATATRVVTLDRVGPVIEVTDGPEEGTTVAASSLDLAFAASDANLDTVTCTIDGTTSDCPAGHVAMSDLTEGPHTVAVTASDKAGNVTSLTRHFVRQRPATAFTASSSRPTYGDAATLTASSLPAGSTGAVTFSLGATTLCNAPVVDGTATCAGGAGLAVGSHAGTAAYSGDDTHAPVVQQLTLTVDKLVTTLKVRPTQARTHRHHRVTLVATTSPRAATGTVIFRQSGRTLCRGTLRSGVATCRTSATLTKGLHRVVATYGGSATYRGSTARTSFKIT